jgi:glutathione synthase/RimK-type ligase-like ATP-grasp enzyme
MKKILIISNSLDNECDSIIRHLKKNQTDYFRLQTNELQALYSIDLYYTPPQFQIKHRKTGHSIKSSEVGAVWWSHTSMPGEANELFEPHLREFIDEEYYSSLIALLAILEAKIPVINHPVKHLIAGHKSYQQRIADRVGFRLPNQLITNNGNLFLNQYWSNSSVYKPISNSQYISNNKKSYFATVKEINKSMAERIRNNEIELYLHHFQEKIDVLEEYRITVFGDHVMAFRVEGSRGFDWRIYINELKYRPFINDELTNLCRKYMTQMGILFGCFDIILGKDKKYYFIECNAPGYFLFLDSAGRYGLARKFAQYLRSICTEGI